MIYKLFSVWDLKTEAYMQPFFSPTIASGIRAFSDAAQEQTSTISKHPGDYQLHHIGDFDDTTGVLTDINNVALGSGTDFITDRNPASLNPLAGDLHAQHQEAAQ